MIAVPKGFIVGDFIIEGILVNYFSSKERTPYRKRVEEMYKHTIDMDDEGVLDSDEQFISITIQCNPGGYTQMCVPRHLLDEALKSKTTEEMFGVIGKLNTPNQQHLSLSEREKSLTIQRFALKLYVALCLYVQAGGSEVLVDGMPVTKPGQVNFPDMQQKTAKKVTLKSLATNKKNPHAHYRSWHFRQLTDDRYYKGEYEGMEPGSRIIFVRDTYVGDKIKAKTLRDKK